MREPVQGRERILYVEDDDDVRTSLEMLLTDEGYDVTAVARADLALAQLQRHPFDVVLTDYNLPSHNADWLLAQASAAGLLQDTAVIVLSGTLKPSGVEGYPFLSKPIDVEVLCGWLQSAVVGRRGRAPSGPTDASIVLRLYVSEGSAATRRAERNLRQAVARLEEGLVRVEVRSIRAGDEAMAAELEAHRIVVTPTLVRLSPGPMRWALGDLSKPGSVEALIAAAPLAPEAADI